VYPQFVEEHQHRAGSAPRYLIEGFNLTNREKAMSKEENRSPNPGNPPPDEAADRPACVAAPDEAAECPQCAETMRLWASFYRCPNCGYKESCCF
jgi:hypothetical protein